MVVQRLRCAPSPRLRGRASKGSRCEGWGEGEFPLAELWEIAPHPPRKSAATSPSKWGEVAANAWQGRGQP